MSPIKNALLCTHNWYCHINSDPSYIIIILFNPQSERCKKKMPELLIFVPKSGIKGNKKNGSQ